jgi:hypothetical protein
LVNHVLTDIAAVGTALGVGFTAWQLLLNREQARTEFEDRMTETYRALVASLPVEVFFDLPVDREIVADHIGVFYRYFDLCNEQAFLRKQNRISDETWEQWRDGMEGNMGRDAFATAWHELIEPNIGKDFQEFKCVLARSRSETLDTADGAATPD